MEDSSWEGWTTPPGPPSPDLGYPAGRRVEGSPPSGWLGEIRTQSRATADAIKYAERSWPQRRAKDFKREGRQYVERGTGTTYTLVRGNPLLGDGDPEVADCFVVADGVIWFLRRADRPRQRSQSLGVIGGVR